MNSLKKFLKLFLYGFFIITVFSIMEDYRIVLRRVSIDNSNPIPLFIYTFLSSMLIGLLFAFPYFIEESRKTGKIGRAHV